MIPKIIHYCWFSNDPLPDSLLNCIASWKKHLGDYEFKKWTLTNTKEFSNLFFRQCIAHKRWAFASDYIRFCVLHQYGGIYLDADIIVLKPFPDQMLSNNVFLGYQNSSFLEFAVIGSLPKQKIFNQILDLYQEMEFDFINPPVLPRLVSDTFMNYQKTDQLGLKLYPPEVFYPLPFEKRFEDYTGYINDSSITVHLWDFSWESIYKPRKFGRVYFELFCSFIRREYSLKFVLKKITNLLRAKINDLSDRKK